MNRRNFVGLSLGLASSLFFPNLSDAKKRKKKKTKRAPEKPIETTSSRFEKLVKFSQTESWQKYSIGALIGIIGNKLLETPYVGGTLEINDEDEACVVNLIELDCVTFYENCLAFARMIKKGRSSMDDFTAELTFIRYRNGKIYNYASRLHYTSDWISDNVKKGVVDDISIIIGGEAIKFDLYFMSENSEQYPALKKVPKLIAEIESIEDHINKKEFGFIPTDRIASIADRIQTGDIIGIVTSKAGLDYSHTGLAYVDNGNVKLLHASSKFKKVVLDTTIAEYLAANSSAKGISVLRPREV